MKDYFEFEVIMELLNYQHAHHYVIKFHQVFCFCMNQIQSLKSNITVTEVIICNLVSILSTFSFKVLINKSSVSR